MQKSLSFALLLRGFASLIIEILLIRELLVTFSGNELSIGIILANWLILIALGSFVLGRFADKVKYKIEIYASLQLIISIYLPFAIYLCRTIKNIIGVVPGEAVGIIPIIYGSFLILIPLCVSDGAQFSFGCKIYSDFSGKPSTSVGRVYIFESIGAVAGGLIFTYLLMPFFHSLQVALFIAILNLLSAILLFIFFYKGYFPFKIHWEKFSFSVMIAFLCLIFLVLSIYLLISNDIDKIHWNILDRQWKEQELVHYQNSMYSNITVTTRENQFNFFSNGIPLFSTPDPDIAFVEEFVHLPLLFHSYPKNILLIGGGAGGVLNEIAKYSSVEDIHYIELDPLIIKVVQKYATPLTRAELNDPKVKIKYTDGRLWVKGPTGNYDVVLVNLPPPSTLQLNRFYTVDFFQEAKKVLDQDGIIAILAPGSLTYLNEELINLNTCLLLSMGKVFPYTRVIPGDFNILLASSNREILNLDADRIIQRFKDYQLSTKLFTEFYIKYKLDPERLKWYVDTLSSALSSSKKIRINNDLFPSGVFYYLAFWNTLYSPGLNNIFRLMEKVNLKTFLFPLILFIIIFLLIRAKTNRLKKASLPVAIATTGFAGMAFQLIIILTFQSFYGNIYHRIGLLATAFMAGLALGSIVVNSIMERIKNKLSLLIKLEAAIVLYSVCLPFLLTSFHLYLGKPWVFSSVQIMLLLLSLISGILVGAEFPLANKIYLIGLTKVSWVAGMLYTADLIGAWLGAFVVSVMMIPILGILATCLFIIAINLISLFLVATSGRIDISPNTRNFMSTKLTSSSHNVIG